MNIFSKYENVTIDNTRIHKENIRNDLNMQLFLLSTVQILATFTWILFYLRISSLKELSSREMKKTLTHLGVDRKFFVFNSIFESFFILVPSLICLYASYRYLIKNMVFEINIYDVINEYRVIDYLAEYQSIMVIAILSIILLLFILESIIQRERSK